jgi:hypothetical protein
LDNRYLPLLATDCTDEHSFLTQIALIALYFALIQAFLTPFASIGTNLPASSLAAPICNLRLQFFQNLHQSL